MCFNEHADLEDIKIENYSKARQIAEKAFNRTQVVDPAATGQVLQKVDTIAMARQDKTARLRNARLAKEALDATRGSLGSSGKTAGTIRRIGAGPSEKGITTP